MKFTKLALVLLLTTAMETHAEFSATIGVVSDYVWRGNTQTDEKPALQLGAGYHHSSGFYGGLWGSNVDDGGDDSYEIDVYGGYGFSFNKWFFDLSYVSYNYPKNERRVLNSDGDVVTIDESVLESTDEVILGIGRGFLNLMHAYNLDELYEYTKIGADFALNRNINLNLGVGLNNPAVGPNDADYLLGLSVDFNSFLLDMNYTATDSSEAGDDRLTFGIRKEY